MNAVAMRVLVVGGYGGFGGRLVSLLQRMDGVHILVAGRSLTRARNFCKADPGGVEPVRLDRSQCCRKALREARPDLVIDAAGPFQRYGSSPYSLIETCIELGVSYLDLADARDFVCGVVRFDDKARDRNVYVLSGASSVPALSGAAIAELARSVGHVDRIDIGIAPAGGTLVGLNVVRAILSYVGQQVPVVREGRWRKAWCWTDLRPQRLEIDRQTRLNRRYFSLCDVPDLEIWPARYPGASTVYFGAALEPVFNHLALWVVAWLVRLRLLPRAEFLARPLYAITRWLPAGMRRGAMVVRVHGRRSEGAGEVAEWTLVADGDDGLYIPTMACAAIVARVLRGQAPSPGARPCCDDLTLDDFEDLFAAFAIRTSVRRACGPSGDI